MLATTPSPGIELSSSGSGQHTKLQPYTTQLSVARSIVVEKPPNTKVNGGMINKMGYIARHN